MLKKVNARVVSLLLAVIMMFMIFPVNKAYAATDERHSSLARAKSNITVYYNMTCLENEIKGYIYAGEFFTVLVDESDANAYYVQYNITTSPGYKQGYIKKSNNYTEDSNTCAGQMIRGSTVYFGPDENTYNTVGSVNYGECVAVLAKSDNGKWYYIEYDTVNGRKRGYVPVLTFSCLSKVVLYCPEYRYAGSSTDGPFSTTKTHALYAGETTKHNQVGTIPAGSTVKVVNSFQEGSKNIFFIMCEHNGKYTSGYILDGFI